MVEEIYCAETGGPDETRALGAAVATCLRDGDLVVLTGELGAGKTCFTQGVGAGLGVDEAITSPTFVIAAAYRGRLPLNHLDAYRIEPGDGVIDLDLPDLLERGVTVVEWGERLGTAVPAERLTIAIGYVEEDDGPTDDPFADPRRRFRFELSGTSWDERRPGLVSAVARWGVPC